VLSLVSAPEAPLTTIGVAVSFMRMHRCADSRQGVVRSEQQ